MTNIFKLLQYEILLMNKKLKARIWENILAVIFRAEENMLTKK